MQDSFSFVAGNLCQTPDLRYHNGDAVTTLRIAINNGTDRQGKDLEPTFIDLQVWGDKAEHILANDPPVGCRVMATGKQSLRVNVSNGKTYHNFEMRVQDIGFSALFNPVSSHFVPRSQRQLAEQGASRGSESPSEDERPF